MSAAPFIILALPRSRTAWLSRFLTYRDWTCGHEEMRHLRSLDDLAAWFSQDCAGTAETGAAPYWRLIHKFRPNARIVTVRRPVQEVVDSMLALDMRGVCTFDRASLTKQMERLDRKLDQIEQRVPDVLSVSYDDLEEEQVCAQIFEHCLPYRHDPAWWQAVSVINIQCSMPALMRYFFAHRAQLERLNAIARHTMLSDLALQPVALSDGVTIQSESFDAAFRDGQALFAEHSVRVGEAPDSFKNKNLELMRSLEKLGALQIITARCNGRMFGYLATVLSPSLESPDIKSSVHTTFFASKDFPGLGLKMQRAALAALRERGVSEVFFRAGPRGDGPRMGTLYRRLGAEDDGAMFRLNMRLH